MLPSRPIISQINSVTEQNQSIYVIIFLYRFSKGKRVMFMTVVIVLQIPMMLLNQGFLVVKVKSSRKLNSRYHDRMCRRWPRICSVCGSHNLIFRSPFMTYYLTFNKNNMTGATSGARTAYPSRSSEITLVFKSSIYGSFCSFGVYLVYTTIGLLRGYQREENILVK